MPCLATECLLEFRHVRDYVVDAEHRQGVRIGRHDQTSDLRPHTGAPRVRIRKEEALVAVNHSVAEVDKWEQAHFEEDEMRSAVKDAKAKYEDALREEFFGF